MRCPSCSYFNDSKAQYCKSCGSLLSSTTTKESILNNLNQRSPIRKSTITKSEDQTTINNLLLVLGTVLGTSALWFLFDIVSTRFEFLVNGDNGSLLGFISSWGFYLTFFTDGILLLVLLITAIRVTNEKVRTFLLIYFFIELIIIVGYRFWR